MRHRFLALPVTGPGDLGRSLTPMMILAWLFALLGVSFAAEKANDTLIVTSLPDSAAVEWNRKVIGTTPLTSKVGEYAFNVRKTSLFSKRLNQPVVLRVSKEGYVTKEITITKPMVWQSFNGRNRFAYFVITSNSFQIDLDKISAVHAALTNADIIKLKAAGFGDDLIIDKINNNPAAFHLVRRVRYAARSASRCASITGRFRWFRLVSVQNPTSFDAAV